MNNLSWLLYIANVCGNIDFEISIVFAMSIVAGIISVIWFFGLTANNASQEEWTPWRKFSKWVVSCFVISSLVGAVIPSKDTVYAIAASETAGTVLNSTTGNKAVEALNAWLDRQIHPKEENSDSDKK